MLTTAEISLPVVAPFHSPNKANNQVCAAAADGFNAGAATDAVDPEGAGILRWIVLRGHFRRRASARCCEARAFSSADVAKVASPADASVSFAAAREGPPSSGENLSSIGAAEQVGRKLVLCEEKHHPARKDSARALCRVPM